MAQNTNNQNNPNNQNQNNEQNRPPKMIQPDMQKDTVALFQGHFAGPIKSTDVLKEDSLVLNKNGLLIIGFSLVFRKDTAMTKFDSRNNKLTPEMKTALKDLKPGQNFAFINIRIIAKGGIPHKPTYDHIDMFIDKEKK